MVKTESVFEQTYANYLHQISKRNLKNLQQRLGFSVHNGKAVIELFGEPHRVSADGIFGPSNTRPSFDVCVILSKYILLCPETIPMNKGWVSYRDFKDSGPLLKFYSNDVEKAISDRFSGNASLLQQAAQALGGYLPSIKLTYDVTFQFNVLPKIPLLLLFNNADDDFPSTCSVLFQNDAEHYLDAECLAMVGALLCRRLKNNSFI